MPLLELQELGHGKRRGSFTSRWKKSTATDSFERERRLVVPYRAVMDDPEENEITVLEAALVAGLPDQWEEHPDDILMTVSEYELTEEDVPERWLINVVYEYNQDPTDEPALITVATGSLDWVVEQDIEIPANAIAASNRRPFEPPPTIPNGHLIYTITKNMLAFDGQDIINNYLFRVNAAEYLGFDAGKLWLAEVGSGPLEIRNGVKFYPTRWVFHGRERGWKLKLLDCGFEEYDSVADGLGNNPYTTIRDRTGAPISTPALLNGAGVKLPTGDPPVFLEFEVYQSAEFSALGLFPP